MKSYLGIDISTQITQNNNLTQTLTDKHLLRLIAKTVTFLHKQVAQLEALMQTKLAASPDLLSKVNRLRQAQGIGVLTATPLVALMPELGSLSDTQAAALAARPKTVADPCLRLCSQSRRLSSRSRRLSSRSRRLSSRSRR